jgi:N-acetylneuraminic acid mutarotase
MRKLVAPIVIAGTAFMIAPAAYAADYSEAISGCKSAITSEVGGDKVYISLGNVKKAGKNVRLDFKVKVTTNNQRTRLKARCLVTRDGQVVDLAIV